MDLSSALRIIPLKEWDFLPVTLMRRYSESHQQVEQVNNYHRSNDIPNNEVNDILR